jgi:hypothetical protein
LDVCAGYSIHRPELGPRRNEQRFVIYLERCERDVL